MENLERIIAGHHFLEGLSKGYLDKIISCASAADFSAGKYIFRQGEPAENFYLLTKGRVTVGLESAEKGSLLVETLDAGAVLGWSWLVPPYKWRFNAQATSSTHAVAVNGAKLRVLCETDHAFGYEIMKRFSHVISERLEMANLQILELSALKREVKV